MRVFRALFLVLHLSLLVILSHGKTKSTSGSGGSGQKLSFGQLSTMDLESVGFDGDILFDIEWPGLEAKEQAIQVAHRIQSRPYSENDQHTQKSSFPFYSISSLQAFSTDFFFSFD